MGLDVHKRTDAVAVLAEDDRVFTRTAPADPDKLVQTIGDLGVDIDGVCFQTGPIGFALARVLREAEIPVVLAAPSKATRSVSAGANTDRLDCIKLALLASGQALTLHGNSRVHRRRNVNHSYDHIPHLLCGHGNSNSFDS